MKNNILFKLLTVCLLAAILCFPTVETHAETTDGSQLVGLLITMEDLSPYIGEDGVLWAEVKPETSGADTEYLFDGVEGLRLISFISDEGEESYFISNVDDGFCNADFNFEDESNIKIEAAILYAPAPEEVCFFYNPVLRMEDGRVCAVPGDFMSISAEMNPPGASVGQTIRDEGSHTVNGEEITDVTEVGLEIQTVREPLHITLLQFSADHALLQAEEYAPTDVPEEIVMLPEADYLLLETLEKGADGGTYTRREIFGREEDFLNTRSCQENGICLQQYHEIIWGE